MSRDKKNYSDFTNVKKMKNELIPEEFPEGSWGMPINQNQPVEGKSTPWLEEQRRQSAFIYPDKERHDNLPRQAPGSHPLHDESNNDSEENEQ